MAAAISRAEIISLLQQDYSVDKVLQLFQALRAQESADQSDLDAAYNVNEPQLAAEIVRTTDLLNQKTAECDGIDAQIAAEQQQAQDLQDNIQDAQDTINSNNDKASQLADARCAANLLFVSKLGQAEEAVEFLSYLRSRVADPAFADYLNEQSGAFIQLKTALASKKEHEILSLLAKHHMLSLLQKGKGKQDNYEGESDLSDIYTATVRTEAEIGTDYQDNDRGALQVQGLNNVVLDVNAYIEQLLGFIDQLVTSIQDSITNLQGAETAAVQAFIEYRRQLDDQNYVLQQYIDAATGRLNDLQAVIANNQEASGQCRSEIPPLEQGVQSAQDNHDSYVEAYNNRRDNLVNTIALLDQVIQIYQEQVVSVASQEYNQRIDDYIPDQTFDQTAGFTNRESVQDIADYNAQASVDVNA